MRCEWPVFCKKYAQASLLKLLVLNIRLHYGNVGYSAILFVSALYHV
jgi:hypothetical protein